MKILFLVPSGTQRSHARYRVLPIVKMAQDAGMDVSYKSVPRGSYARYSFFSRLPFADIIISHRELFSTYELATLRRLTPKLVYDCSDAVWTLPEREKGAGNALGRTRLARRLERVTRFVDMCIVDNRTLADKISEYNEHVAILPTPIDVKLYDLGTGGKEGGTILVGWMGTPGDESYLESTLKLLEPHAGSIQYSVVSNKPYIGPGREFALWASWSQDEEPHKLQAMDIGLTPLADDEFTRAGCGAAVLRYMASGVAVVASDVGRHREIIDHGIDGFLVREEADWAQYVMRLAQDPVLRTNMVTAARAKVVQQYSLESVAPRLWEALGI